MRRELLQQARAECRRFGFEVPLALISMFDRQPPVCDLLVVDEAQHDGALSMATLHGVIQPRFVLGLSATPFRADRVKLCFERVVRDASIQSLIHDGYLSPYHHYTIESWTPEAVAETWLHEPGRWGKSLVFFRTAAESVRFASLLRGAGVRAEVVTGSSDREGQLRGFEAGVVRVLVSMIVLSEGFDCPALRSVFCRPAGKSPTVQMSGRVFRRHESCAFKQVVQCRATRVPLPRLVAPAAQYLSTESGWRTLGDAHARAMAHSPRGQTAPGGAHSSSFTSALDVMAGRMQRFVARHGAHALPDYVARKKLRPTRLLDRIKTIHDDAV